MWEIFFLKNHTQNAVEKLVLGPFLKNQNWAKLWINSLKFYTVCLFCMSKSRAIEIHWNQRADHLPLSHVTLLQKIKGSPKLVSLPYFLHVFLKNISHVYSVNWPNFIVWLPWLLDVGKYVYCNCLLTSLWHH